MGLMGQDWFGVKKEFLFQAFITTNSTKLKELKKNVREVLLHNSHTGCPAARAMPSIPDFAISSSRGE
jgi:hypothetical protein